MPPNSGRRKYKGPGRASALGWLAALGPPSNDATPDHDGEDGSHADAGFDSEIKEAKPLEATSSTPCFSRATVELLEEQITMLRDRLATARFDSRGA